MVLSPESFEEKLGLGRIRARLKALVLGETGVRAVDSLDLDADRERIEPRLRIAGELQVVLARGEQVPLQAGGDLIPILRSARPEGSALTVEMIMEILQAAQTARLVKSFCERRRDLLPTVAENWAVLTECRNLEKEIESIFDRDGNVRDSASPELRQIRKDLQRSKQALRSKVAGILSKAVADGFAAEDQATIRTGRVVIPVVAGSKRKIPGFVHDVSATGQTVYIEPRECLELNNAIRELEIGESREIERLRRVLTDLIRNQTEDLSRNADLLTELDLRLAIARLAREIDGVVPQLNNQGLIRINKGRNPELLLVYRSQGREDAVVPLDIEIGGRFRTLVISGPNAGGKSIAMKTIGLMVAMLELGIPVPVDESSSFFLFDRILVDIGDAQSVEDDLSTYSSHLRNLAYMLTEADERTLILIDEAGTGTDPDEGSALARAVMEQLLSCNARTVVTTHHGSLKAFAHDEEGVANGSMSFDLKTLKPTYAFRLDVPGASYAAEIASKVGLPDTVIARARELLGSERARMESLIVSLESTNKELDDKLMEATRTLNEARSERDRFEKQVLEIQAEKETIQQRALEEADEVLKSANRTIERVVRDIRESQADPQITKAARARLEDEKERLRKDAERLKKRRRSRNAEVTSDTAPHHDPKTTRSNSGIIHDAVLEVGDQVSLDGGEPTGEVLSIKGSEAMVRLGDLQARVGLDRLTKVGGARVQQVSIRQANRSGNPLASSQLEQRIDVRGCRVDEAIPRVVTLLDEAVAANLERVEILHGKGTGALRVAIQEYLSSSDQVSRMEEAPWNEGGAGVTFVWLND